MAATYEQCKESIDAFRTYALTALGLDHEITIETPYGEFIIPSEKYAAGDLTTHCVGSLVQVFNMAKGRRLSGASSGPIRLFVKSVLRMECGSVTVNTWADNENIREGRTLEALDQERARCEKMLQDHELRSLSPNKKLIRRTVREASE